MGIINSIKFRDKIQKRLRLTNCDSQMFETLDKNPQELQLHPPKKYKCS